MTFLDLAQSVFGDMPKEELVSMAEAIEVGYIEGLKSCTYTVGGVAFLFAGPRSKMLSEAILKVRASGGTL